MTAEGSTGAPLRQQIAEAIHAPHCFFNEEPGHCQPGLNDYDAADAVVALLNLTEEWVPGTEDNPYTSFGAPSLEAARQHVEWLGGDADAHWYWKRELVSAVSFWQRLPSTPPHTSSSEPA